MKYDYIITFINPGYSSTGSPYTSPVERTQANTGKFPTAKDSGFNVFQ